MSAENITFEQAWRDFLLVRPFTNRMSLKISRTPENLVSSVEIGAFKMLERGGEQYIIDDVSCPGVVLGYPKKIVEDELNKKIIQKLVGKTLPETEFAAIKSKLDTVMRQTDIRLGCANSGEIQQALLEKNFWEVMFSLHQLIEYRLRKLLMYKSMRKEVESSSVTLDPIKRKICEEEIKTFKHMIEIAYLFDALNREERDKLLSFDGERDSIAHKLLKSDVTDVILEKACAHGIEVLNLLQLALERIVPKPPIITMRSFCVNEFIS